MERAVPNLRRRPVEIVCGKGNNGGDGLVVFRYLATHGYRARAWVLAPLDALAGDAKANLRSALALGLKVESLCDEPEIEEAFRSFSAHTVVVDAILGTGLTRAAHGVAAAAIRALNRAPAFRVAVDIPSGLCSDSGEVPGEAIEADLTVALAAPKLCHLLPPACFRCGRLEVTDIGIPETILESTGGSLVTIEPQDLCAIWRPRSPDAHKGSFGHLLIVSGSVGKTGAAVMAGSAAIKAGAGLVTIATPASALPMMAPALLESMWEPLKETPEGSIAGSALPRVREILAGKTALALGPGLGQHPETVAFVKALVPEVTIPTVLDADGINAFEGDAAAIPRGRPLALTPHPGEAARLLACAARDIQRDRLDAVRQLARRIDAHVALKGYRTLVGEPSGRAHINLTGNAGMASGGTGDVLTGMVGSLLAQGLEVGASLRLGVYLHGLSGDLAARKTGHASLAATDLIRCLPRAIRHLEGCGPRP